MARTHDLKVRFGSANNPIVLGGCEIVCYYLNDGTRVLEQRGMLAALGMVAEGREHDPGRQLVRLVNHRLVKPHASKALCKLVSHPLVFQTGCHTYLGYDFHALEWLVDAVLALPRKLSPGLMRLRDRCLAIEKDYHEEGLVALIDEATHFRQHRMRASGARFLNAFISKKVNKYRETFKEEFWREICRLKGWTHRIFCRRPKYFGHLVNDLIYNRLGPRILEMLRSYNPVKENGRREHYHHQFFRRSVALEGSDREGLGYNQLENHLAAVTALMRGCDDWQTFYPLLERAYPANRPFGDDPLGDFGLVA